MLKKFAIIGFGGTMIGIGVNGFILPFHLINGGFFGISLLANYLWGLKVGLTFICLNIPVFIYAFRYEPEYFVNGLAGAVVSGFMLDFLMPFSGMIHLPILSSVIIGAVLIGIGVGFMLRNHISPGGMDLLALLIAKKTNVNVGIICFAIDAVIITTGLILLKDARLLYSLVIVSIIGLFACVITSIRKV
ncbi:YitT family protein [Paenibacillus sp. BSR1-1]|uniref:YitT family protein n=1 Tax=Paenibacillus sp. BSR1-1 TaxID=3020845 RepID=UPI0025B09621|nr:YitT family protein [Paenibacillus sp. BSR1-1]MDN3018667.1 YitT family protein [Paenibacillus sp. BSR1-1]